MEDRSDDRAEPSGFAQVEDLGGLPLVKGSGVVWATANGQLNANLVKLPAGAQVELHINNEVDNLLVVNSGHGSVTIDGDIHPLGPDHIAMIPKGARRSIQAESLMMYYSVHVRRSGPDIQR